MQKRPGVNIPRTNTANVANSNKSYEKPWLHNAVDKKGAKVAKGE